MNRSRMNLLTRMLLPVWVVGLAAIGGALGMAWVMTHTESEYSRILVQDMGSAELARETQVTFKIQVQEWKNLLIRGSHSDDDLEKYAGRVRDDGAEVQRLAAELKDRAVDPEVRDLVAGFAREHQALTRAYVATMTGFRGHRDIARADSEVAGIDRAPTTTLDSVVALLNAAGEESATSLEARSRHVRWAVVLLVLLAVATATGVAAWMLRGLALDLGRIMEAARAVADGPMQALVGAMDALGRGDVDAPVETVEVERLEIDRDDEVGDLARTVDLVVDRTRQSTERADEARSAVRVMVGQTEAAVRAARDGDLSVRADASGLEGAYREILEGLNATLDAIGQPIDEAADVLRRVADRDLTVRMEGAYQGDYLAIKRSLNAALDALEGALSEVLVSSHQVAAAAGQIAGGSQSLAEGAGEQASSLEEISSSLQELASMAGQNAGNADEARSLAEAAAGSTEEGASAMERLSASVQRIKESSDATGRIVKTIDEIAFQTNLLALNAAVEAARAGEAGKGFAVVAEEVRSLAMRSADASKETADLIQQSLESSEEGVIVQAEVVEKLGEIRGGVTRVREVMEEIAAASRQQTDGVRQINDAVEQINALTQRSAASSEESASSSEELSGQAQRMNQLVGRFTLSTAGHQPGAGAPAARSMAGVTAGAAGPVAGNGFTPAREGHVRNRSGTPWGADANGSGANGSGVGAVTVAADPSLSPEALIPFDDDEALSEF